MLTPKELEVLGLLSQGLSNLQIADRLHISNKTVSTHKKTSSARPAPATCWSWWRYLKSWHHDAPRPAAADPVVRSGAGGGAGALPAGQQSEHAREHADRRRENPWRDRMLRIGIISENTSPYNIIVDDDLYGLNADYLGYIQQVTGIRFAIYGFADLTQLEQALHDGKIDLLYGIPQSEALHGLAISQPYYVSNLRVLRDRSNDRPVMLNSANARVAIGALTDMQSGGALQAVASQIQRYDNNLQAVYSLLNGSSDYFIADEASASFIIDQLQLGQLYQIESNENLGNLSFVFAAADRYVGHRHCRRADGADECPAEPLEQKIPSYLDTGNADLTTMEKNWVASHRVVYYAAIENNFPFAYRGSDGQPRGYAIDILNIIAQNTGLRFAPLWARNAEQADRLVQSGQASFRAALPLARGVKARYGASMPIHRSLWGVYVGQHANGISTWSDLTGKRIGVLQGDLAQGLVPEQEQTISFDDSKSMYDALANGQLDAWWITSSPPTFGAVALFRRHQAGFRRQQHPLPGGLRRAPRSTSSVGNPR